MNGEYVEMEDWSDSRCPACGELIDHCQGHGQIGDPQGAAALEMHDEGDHSMCHRDGCEHLVEYHDEHPAKQGDRT